jgi:hypothetical protein
MLHLVTIIKTVRHKYHAGAIELFQTKTTHLAGQTVNEINLVKKLFSNIFQSVSSTAYKHFELKELKSESPIKTDHIFL